MTKIRISSAFCNRNFSGRGLLEHLFNIGDIQSFMQTFVRALSLKKTPFEDFCETEEWKAAYNSFYEEYMRAAKREIELRYSVLENL